MIGLLLQKEEQGMDALLLHYGPLMRYIIAAILPNTHDQEDCLSEAAMQVWKKVETFDPQRGSWNAWLTAVTRNHALNYKRNTSVHGNAEEISPHMPSAEPSPEEQALRKERQTEINLALQRLSSKDKTLFYRKYYYLQSTAQIASEMGMTERAVEGRLYRIKKRLRQILRGEGYA
ncbi:MAG: sigma-70 family RNA polymerase sigma factor [Firmicutes bacterium]|nr:sigma-70 family RNA polymerase sigma factor [Bacillota bacterium]